jgi:AcrR family transcriptional regulator
VSGKKKAPCKRPYSLGKRLESSGRTRANILAAARAQLASRGFLNFTLDGLARESGVTRQTIHNLFGTKSGLLEALFDQLAIEGGMERMRFVMQQSDLSAMLSGFVEIFTGFWSRDMLLLRRIHGIAAIDPEFGAVLEARNKRRRMAATRVVGVLGKSSEGKVADEKINALYSLTSFEFYSSIMEVNDDHGEAARLIRSIVEKSLL